MRALATAGKAAPALGLQVELRNGRGWPIGLADVSTAGPDLVISWDGGRHAARVERGALHRWLQRPGEPLVDGTVQLTWTRDVVALQVGAGADLRCYQLSGSGLAALLVVV